MTILDYAVSYAVIVLASGASVFMVLRGMAFVIEARRRP